MRSCPKNFQRELKGKGWCGQREFLNLKFWHTRQWGVSWVTVGGIRAWRVCTLECQCSRDHCMQSSSSMHSRWGGCWKLHWSWNWIMTTRDLSTQRSWRGEWDGWWPRVKKREGEEKGPEMRYRMVAHCLLLWRCCWRSFLKKSLLKGESIAYMAVSKYITFIRRKHLGCSISIHDKNALLTWNVMLTGY